MAGLLRSFLAGNNGNIAVTASLVLLPVMALAGVSIDFARLNAAHGELKSSVDNTAYALVRSDAPIGEKREMAAALIRANHDNQNIEVVISSENGALEVAAREVVDTPMLALIGKGDSVIEASITLGGDTSISSSVSSQEAGTQLTHAQKAEIRRMKARLEQRLNRLLKNSRLTFEQKLKLERQIHARLNSLNSLY